jgi:hypothetical protein
LPYAHAIRPKGKPVFNILVCKIVEKERKKERKKETNKQTNKKRKKQKKKETRGSPNPYARSLCHLFGFVMGKKRSKSTPEVIICIQPTNQILRQGRSVGWSVHWSVSLSVRRSVCSLVRPSVRPSVSHAKVTRTTRRLFGFVIALGRSAANPRWRSSFIFNRPTKQILRQGLSVLPLVGWSVGPSVRPSVHLLVRPSVCPSRESHTNVMPPLRFRHGEEAQQIHAGGHHLYSSDQPTDQILRHGWSVG